jgi:hypothetical protein
MNMLHRTPRVEMKFLDEDSKRVRVLELKNNHDSIYSVSYKNFYFI